MDERLHLPERVRWITPKGTSKAHSRIHTAWFALRVSGPGEGHFFLSAHSRYRLYLNGELIGYGPCRGDHARQFFDEYALRLPDGGGVLSVKVVAFPPHECAEPTHAGPDYSMNRACGSALCVYGEISGVDISTGVADWQSAVTEEMTPIPNKIAPWLGYTERVNAAKMPPAFQLPGGGTRTLCAAMDDPWGVCPPFQAFKRPIPPLFIGAHKRLMKPAREPGCAFDGKGVVTVPPNSSVVLELDAGELITALVGIKCSGGKGGRVQIAYAESYWDASKDGKQSKGNRAYYPGSVFLGYEDELLLNGGETLYEPFLVRVFRFVRLTLEAKDQPLALSAPVFRRMHYLLDAISGVGEETAPWVKDVWDISLRTLRYCMHETYEDCPYYEQMQYTMDTRLQMLFTYRVSGDTRLALRALSDYHASRLPSGLLQSRYPSGAPQVIPCFSFHFAFMLEDYYLHSGDAGTVREYLGTLMAVLNFFRSHKVDGLVEHLGYWQMIDWVDAWPNGVPPACETGPESVHNFQYAYALQTAARLARALALNDLGEQWDTEASEVLDALMKRCYDSENQLFRSGPSDTLFCQHAQVWAVLCGVGDSPFRRALMEKALEDKALLPCSFPMMFYVFRALEAVGMYARTQSLWGMWRKLLPLGLTTVPETPLNPRSDCHAWGALMLYEFPTCVLGVHTLTPGCSRIEIAPKALYLGRAEGRACVPGGSLYVKWQIIKEEFQLDVRSDCDRRVTIRTPDGQDRALMPGQPLCIRMKGSPPP